jgi:sugar phosphate isomerase/epimerase
MTAKPVALQLYTLRARLAAEFDGTLDRIAAIGYAGVEPFGVPADLDSQAARIHSLGLAVPSAHIPPPQDAASREAALRIAAAYHTRYIVCSIMPEGFASPGEIARTCDALNAMGQFAADNGLTLGYHNHWWEFEPVAGQVPFAVLRRELDPSIIFEVDIYWAQVGGRDPAALLADLGPRAPLIHVKDGPADTPQSAMVALGDGAIDVPGAVNAGAADWLIIELDKCDGDMLEAVERSFTYLTDKGLGHGR